MHLGNGIPLEFIGPDQPLPCCHLPPDRIVKQPKARQAKSQARVNAFVELTARTKDVPKEDLKADFGQKGMIRQGGWMGRHWGRSVQAGTATAFI